MKIIIHAHWRQEVWEKEPSVSLYSCDMRQYFPGAIYAGTHEIELAIEPPDFSAMVISQVTALRHEQGGHQHAIDVLDEKIQALMCIEHMPAAAV